MNPDLAPCLVFEKVADESAVRPGQTVTYTYTVSNLCAEDMTNVTVTRTLPQAMCMVINGVNTQVGELITEMLPSGDVVTNVVDATNLERNLYLTLQLLESKVPVVVALNLWDDTKHRGIGIDLDKLRGLLGVPVTPTVAVSGEGIKDLVSAAEIAEHLARARSDRRGLIARSSTVAGESAEMIR